MKYISKHLSEREACNSWTAKRLGIDNCPKSSKIWENIQLLANAIFEPLRVHFGVPIKVNSLYRSERLNRAIGGSPTSAHLKGLAIDIDDDFSKKYDVTNRDFFNWVKNNLNFDQLIWEFGNDNEPDWVHIGIKRNFGKNRHQVLRSFRDKNGQVYYKHLYHKNL
jgi:hypothetical protein